VREFDTLAIMAEVSVALAGFASIVVLFKRQSSGRWHPDDANRFVGMVIHALLAVFFSLLPLVLATFAVQASTNWGVSSALLGFATLLQTLVSSSVEAKQGHNLRVTSTALCGLAVVLFQVLNATGVVWSRVPGPYVAGVGVHLSESLYLFVHLVMIRPSDIEPA
jgi:hypothetical protein